jgi:hypothetical protein
MPKIAYGLIAAAILIAGGISTPASAMTTMPANGLASAWDAEDAGGDGVTGTTGATAGTIVTGAAGNQNNTSRLERLRQRGLSIFC